MPYKKLTIILAGLASFAAIAQVVIPTPPPPPPTLPPVVVTAPTLSGGTVLCTGEACGWVIESMHRTWEQDQYASQKPI